LEDELDEDRILWHRLDHPGHELAELALHRSGHVLQGSAVFGSKAGPCRLNYLVVCNRKWETSWGTVVGRAGAKAVTVDVRRRKGRWLLHGNEVSGLDDAIDLDLNFSPSTNLLPIRRLRLGIGEKARVRAAWLRFPDFDLVPLDQSYSRLGESTYRYESDNGFVRDIEVRPSGLVTLYPDFWREEGG
jgi:hypothetical protein